MSKKNPPWHIPTPESKLQIEVGKKYRTRSGDVVEITGNDGHFLWPFVGEFKLYRVGHTSCFCPSGKWIMGEDSENDLIEELPADVPA